MSFQGGIAAPNGGFKGSAVTVNCAKLSANFFLRKGNERVWKVSKTGTELQPSQLADWASAVRRIAEDAGLRIMEVYEAEGELLVEQKSDDSPLTLADRRAHEHIEQALTQLTPSIPILSEESDSLPYEQRSAWQRYWLVDPLDGTKEFISRNGEFTVNIALIEDGRSILGVVHVPVSKVSYTGFLSSSGNSASKWQAGKEFALRTATAGNQALRIVASRRHRGERLEALLGQIAKEHALADVVSIGSSLKMCLIAEGAADLYPRLAPTSEWDTAAAHAILSAAGGEIVNLDFKPLQYNQKASLLNPEFIALGDRDFGWQRLLADASA